MIVIDFDSNNCQHPNLLPDDEMWLIPHAGYWKSGHIVQAYLWYTLCRNVLTGVSFHTFWYFWHLRNKKECKHCNVISKFWARGIPNFAYFPPHPAYCVIIQAKVKAGSGYSQKTGFCCLYSCYTVQLYSTAHSTAVQCTAHLPVWSICTQYNIPHMI